ncbi:MFS transporter [Anaerococcus hydrogenalis]|uniref:Transporter, major facilitator family protein n=2 Tax=Anaerococcus hydrogenalis TaxID=33029 RepID=F0H0N2_9FIRM|nr:MFS transporter [Anaerococcus hydrogenalis]EGC83973.1 transporter, major facilitator family protein [Anaerococcus hydrogenalis ACS-025-V-Sch4]MDK7695671.1 MFS transporter [Anaerococcus hydrogenalis]MDK7697506.1 MFS transporter [Anaerococcus hydrogenalis]MDK7708773.1 MFS transporter [Anaerococcus hydrogenalis]PMC80792.1 MFS transporter [Anaerococcus hydrogenalis]
MKENSIKEKLSILSISLILTSNSIISGSLVYIQQAFNLTRNQAEFIITLSSFTVMIFIFLAEYIALWLGLKKTVLLGLFLVGLSGIFPVIFKTYPAIIMSRIILGAGLGMFNGHSANYINLLYHDNKERTKLHGLRNAAEFTGQIILFTLAGILVKINYIYTFLLYTSAFLIMIFFKINVSDVKIKRERAKINFNPNVFLFIIFAMVVLLNATSMTMRFPFVASLSRGMDVNTSFYLNFVPIVGMVSAFLFTPINLKLKNKTIFFGLSFYLLANLLIINFEKNLIGFLFCILLLTFGQSMCMPYIFAEVPRFVKGHSSRIATNLIFVGCNIGVFMAPIFMKNIDKILKTSSLSKGFIGFVIIYLIFIGIFYRRIKK